MNKKPPPKASTGQTELKITQHVEQLTLRFANALNARNFDPKSAAWKNIAKDFQCEVEYPYQPTKLPLPKLLEVVREISDMFPAYHYAIKELHTEIFEKVGHAEVFVKNEFSGAPPGVVTQGVGMLVYRLIEGSWTLVEHRAAAGLDALGSCGC